MKSLAADKIRAPLLLSPYCPLGVDVKYDSTLSLKTVRSTTPPMSKGASIDENDCFLDASADKRLDDVESSDDFDASSQVFVAAAACSDNEEADEETETFITREGDEVGD